MARLITPHGEEFAISPRDSNEGFATEELDQLVGGWCKAFLLTTGELLVVNSLASVTQVGEENSKATHLLRYAVDDPGGEVRGYALLVAAQDLDLLPWSLQTTLAPGRTNEVRTVLLLDHDHEVRSAIALGLEQHNFRVLQAPTAIGAVIAAANHPVQLVVADVSALQPEALETLRTIQASHPQAKVLLISGYHRSTIASSYPGLVPGHDFLQKPFSFVLLAKVISQMAMTTGSGQKDESDSTTCWDRRGQGQWPN